jgi:hypothetical protein
LIRKLVGDGRLAARVPGEDERLQSNAVECPICFLYYNQINLTDCCSAFCCTECFLQLKPPDGKKNGSDTSSSPSSKKGSSNKVAQAGCDCPFCNAPRVMVKMSSNQANLSKIAEREEEEQRIIEAKIRASLEVKDNISKDGISPLVAPDDNNADRRFGQSLTRLASFKGETEQGVLVASVDERKQLEDEMKQQHQHPLVRRIQEEAEEASNARAAAYARSMSDGQSRRTRLGRYSAGRSSLFQRSRSEVCTTVTMQVDLCEVWRKTNAIKPLSLTLTTPLPCVVRCSAIGALCSKRPTAERTSQAWTTWWCWRRPLC